MRLCHAVFANLLFLVTMLLLLLRSLVGFEEDLVTRCRQIYAAMVGAGANATNATLS